MFDNVKKLYELKKLQDSFKKETLTYEDRGVLITMNGNFEIENLVLNPALNIEEQAQVLKHGLNKVREDIQKTLAKKMMASGFSF